MIDRSEFAHGMALLGATYGRAVDKPLMRLYFSVLNAVLTTAEFHAALTWVVATERFWPTPAVLLGAVGRKPTPEEAKLAGAEIFGEVLDMRAYGPSGYVLDLRRVAERFGEAGVRAVRAVGGPRRFRDLSVSEEPFARKEFATAYATASSVEDRAAHLKLLNVDDRVSALAGGVAQQLDARRKVLAISTGTPVPPRSGAANTSDADGRR